ncbi:MAG: hypothetical protein P1U86_18320 [Verrucomicrobiales bacterium]|nr:hypothetical protein [Verrucomicrobiales bacterium]
MKLKSILAAGVRRHGLTFVCEPPMTKEFANGINELVDSRSDGERSHLSFLSKEGNLVVSGIPDPLEKSFFDELQASLNEVASKHRDAEEISGDAENSHRAFVENVSEISGLPIE